MDICRSVNMIIDENDVNKNEANHAHKKEMVSMHKIHDVLETRTRHRKLSYYNIVRGS